LHTLTFTSVFTNINRTLFKKTVRLKSQSFLTSNVSVYKKLMSRILLILMPDNGFSKMPEHVACFRQ